jgi:hypothetical protein
MFIQQSLPQCEFTIKQKHQCALWRKGHNRVNHREIFLKRKKLVAMGNPAWHKRMVIKQRGAPSIIPEPAGFPPSGPGP